MTGRPVRSASPGCGSGPGFGRQAVVVLVHVVTTPRTSGRIVRAPASETRAPVPVRDPEWVANRSWGEHE
ncbi:hypothetical protein OG230_00005 [Streptomyces sp. NBC_00234]|uniref:hypothetical protein n=1 Tax=Streptomyces sp. NBC_00234 TaxID=2903638 RepID=UPI002E290693|nr:hypothetical protein [Streptomyces sp. NBC_00234]